MVKLPNTLSRTNYKFPGQTAVYHGKVRDVYMLEGSKAILIATDRISAFDVKLSEEIPYKGQVLNQLSAYFLNQSKNVVNNWLEATPDPNVSLGILAEPLKVELVIRGSLVGHAWREYSKGKREICGVSMPGGMKEYDEFDRPIITPSSKADSGHDMDVSEKELMQQGLLTSQEWSELTKIIYELFKFGQDMAQERGLYLADTKYEFGRYNGNLILIDEVHTPDSSRYFYYDTLQAFRSGKTDKKPDHLSKEFVREWLLERGFSGKQGQSMPELDEKFIQSISNRYIKLYEMMTGQKFIPAETDNIEARIEKNVNQALKGLRNE